MKQTFDFLLMLVMVATVLSCKKSEPELTPAQKIVGKYKVTANTSTENGVVEDNLIGRKACQADDITEFTTDGKILDSEGATACTPPRGLSQPIPYSISADGKTLTLTFTSSSGVVEKEDFVISALTGTILAFGNTRTETNAGVTTTRSFSVTFTKI